LISCHGGGKKEKVEKGTINLYEREKEFMSLILMSRKEKKKGLR